MIAAELITDPDVVDHGAERLHILHIADEYSTLDRARAGGFPALLREPAWDELLTA